MCLFRICVNPENVLLICEQSQHSLYWSPCGIAAIGTHMIVLKMLIDFQCTRFRAERLLRQFKRCSSVYLFHGCLLFRLTLEKIIIAIEKCRQNNFWEPHLGEKWTVSKHICKGIGFYYGVSELLNVSYYIQVYWLDRKAIDKKNASSLRGLETATFWLSRTRSPITLFY